MRKRNHRNHHRDSSISSDRKKNSLAVIIWISAALLAVLLALLLGNSLGKKADRLKSNAASVFSYTYDTSAVAPIEAYFLDIANHTDDSLTSVINALPDTVTAVSLYLRQGHGGTDYSSPVSNAILNGSGNIDLAAAVSLLHGRKIYVSACFDCNSFNITDQNARNAAIALEAALISEAANALVDDIIVLGAPSTDLGVSYAAKLFSEIRKNSSPKALGIALDFDSVLSKSGADALKKYSEFADFCSVDIVNAQSNGKSIKTIADSLLYIFKVYPIRMLVGITGEADFSYQVETLNTLGITNIQAYTKRNSNAVG